MAGRHGGRASWPASHGGYVAAQLAVTELPFTLFRHMSKERPAQKRAKIPVMTVGHTINRALARAVPRLRKLVEERNQLRGDCVQLSAERSQLTGDQNRLRAQRDVFEKRLEDTRAELEEMRAESEALRAELSAVEAERDGFRDAHARLDHAQVELERIGAQLSAVE